MSDSSDKPTTDPNLSGQDQKPAEVLGGTMDAPPIPSADTFAREMNGGEMEADLPVVANGEVDETPELPTRETRD